MVAITGLRGILEAESERFGGGRSAAYAAMIDECDGIAGLGDRLLLLIDDDKSFRNRLAQNPKSADRVRREHIRRVCERCDRNVSETARRLHMHRRIRPRNLGKWPAP